MNGERETLGLRSGTSAEAVSEVERTIARWCPRGVAPEAAAFAREVVGRAGPKTPARARALLFAASRLAAFGAQAGLEPSAEALLQPSLIERFIVCGERSLSPATRRTLRANLRALSRLTCAQPRPEPTPLPRERAKPPYGEAEIAGFLGLAEAQPTVARRMRASALVCLGAGAGLVGRELRHLRGEDVIERSGGLVVAVSGPRARVVPVLARFHEPLPDRRSRARAQEPLGRARRGALPRCRAAAARARAAARQLAQRMRQPDRPPGVHAGGRRALLAAPRRPRGRAPRHK